MIDTLTLSRELTKVGIPSAHADAIAVSAHGTRAETRGVLIADGSGDPVPRAPRPPLGNGRANTKASFFRLLIVRVLLASAPRSAGPGRQPLASGSSRVKPVTKGYL